MHTWSIHLKATGVARHLLSVLSAPVLLSFTLSLTLTPSHAEEVDWLKRRSGITSDANAITHNGSQFVAVGAAGKIALSADGMSWKAASTPVKKELNAIATQGAAMVAVADGGQLAVSASAGKSWTKIQAELAPHHEITHNLNGVTVKDGQWLAVGYNGTVLRSNDTLNWQYDYVGEMVNLRSVTFAKDLWVAVGDGNAFAYSFDRQNWSVNSLPLPGGSHNFRSVAYSQGQFIAVADDGFVARSEYGETDWDGAVVPALIGARSITSGMDRFVAVTQSGGVVSSADGETWTVEDSDLSGHGIAFGGDSFVTVGPRGAFHQSPPLFGPQSGSRSDHPGASFDEGQPVAPLISLPRWSVNTASLDLVLEGTLFRMNTHGMPIVGQFVFNRQPGDDEPGMFGVGWHFTYQSRIELENGVATLIRGTGARVRFRAQYDFEATPTSPVPYNAPEGNFDELTCYGTHWELKERTTKSVWRYDHTDLDHPARLVRITDRNGNKIVVTVNQATGVISDIRDSDSTSGSAHIIQVNTLGGRCTSIQLPDSRLLQFTVVGQHGHFRLTSIRDMAGYLATYDYDNDGYITHIGRENADNIGFRYASRPHADGKIIQYVHERLGQTSYEFVDGSYGKVRRRDPRGKFTLLEAKDGRTTRLVDPLGAVRSVAYLSRLPVRLTEPSGATVQWEYDDRGNPVKVTDALGHSTSFTFNYRNNLIARENALDHTWYFQYDTKDNLTLVAPPSGPATQFHYDPLGQLDFIIDPLNRTTRFGYDNYGNLTSITDPLNQVTQFHVQNSGMTFTGITDARGQFKQVTLDENERLLSTVYTSVPGSPQTTNTFDAFWQTRRTNELGGLTSVERNLRGFITRLTTPLGHSRQTEFDGDDRPVAKTDAMGRVWKLSYDDAGRPFVSESPDGSRTERKYNLDGKLISVMDANRAVTSFYYDKAGGLTAVRLPDQSLVHYALDPLGRVTRMTNARKQEISYTYDANDRLSTVTHGETQVVATFQYNFANRITQLTGEDGSHTYYQYDAAGRLTRVSESHSGKVVLLAYDATGNPTQITYPDGTILNCTYDTFNRIPIPPALALGASGGGRERANRITGMTWNGGRSASFTHDAASRLLAESHPNGWSSQYSYDPDHRLTSLSHSDASGLVTSILSEYDAAGSIVKEDIDHLVEPPLPTSATASYDRTNKLTTWNGKTPVHDLDGNLLDSKDGRIQAAYDPQNRLTSLIINGETTTITYNALGLRASKTTAGVTTRYCYTPSGRLLFEWDTSETRNHLYRGSHLYAIGSLASGYRYLHSDRQGNIVLVSDNDGDVVESAAYGPHGMTTTGSGDPLLGAAYVGAYGVQHDGAGLYHMRHRQYDATTGRFLQRDPIGFGGGINLYAYANGNPLNRIDPQGTVDILGLAKFLPGSSDDIKRLDKKQRAVEEKGLMASVEDGSFQEERQDRGRTFMKRGKEGAGIALRTTLNAVPGQPSLFTPTGAAWSALKSKMGDVGPTEEIDSGSNDAPSSTSRGDIPEDEPESSDQPQRIVDDTDWSLIPDPTLNN